jgi:SAM-dependent methyltransferase
MRLREFTPDTLAGSFDRGLIFNKLWLIHELATIKDTFSTIYILGSWYGNLSILLARSDIDYKHIVNVDTDAKRVRQGQAIAKQMHVADRIEPMVADANELDYRQLDSNGLVINCSIHDMPNSGWFDHIPRGVMVALQSRTDIDHNINSYALKTILYDGTKQLADPETEYTSLLRIGIR